MAFSYTMVYRDCNYRDCNNLQSRNPGSRIPGSRTVFQSRNPGIMRDQIHRRSQDFVCGGALFFTTQQKLLKIDSCSGWGVHLVSCGGALTHFSCKLGLKKFFSPPWGGAGLQVHPLHPLATPMTKSRDFGIIK